MFGISGEHILVLGIVLLIFGPRRLPELGNTLGKAIRNFKDAIAGVEEASFRQVEEKTREAQREVQKEAQTEHLIKENEFTPQSKVPDALRPPAKSHANHQPPLA